MHISVSGLVDGRKGEGRTWHMDKVRATIPHIIGYSMALDAHAPSNHRLEDFSLTKLH